MRAAAVRLREPGTVKALVIIGNGMTFAAPPPKKGAMKHTDKTRAGQTAARQPEPAQETTVTQIPRRRSHRRRPYHARNRRRDTHRTAAGTGRGNGQSVGRQHGKPGIDYQTPNRGEGQTSDRRQRPHSVSYQSQTIRGKPAVQPIPRGNSHSLSPTCYTGYKGS